jgi:hypothetical protein
MEYNSTILGLETQHKIPNIFIIFGPGWMQRVRKVIIGVSIFWTQDNYALGLVFGAKTPGCTKCKTNGNDC